MPNYKTGLWSHEKFKRKFKGYYTRLKGERVFNLTNGKRTITFESWQQAKRLGWQKD